MRNLRRNYKDMLSIKRATREKINPYTFAGTKCDQSPTLRQYCQKNKGCLTLRHYAVEGRRLRFAHKLAAHFGFTDPIKNKSDLVALACKISELTYGTAYLSKIRTQAAVDGRAYIIWILRTFFEFSYTRIGLCLGRDHSTIINSFQKFDGFTKVDTYPEYKLAAELRKILAD